MDIQIKSIPHYRQRYETIGDYWTQGERDFIQVSQMNPTYEFLVALHELVEQFLCKERGIREESITAFDIEFEEGRLQGETDEPGDQLNAPYHKEHVFASKIEKMLAKELKINFKDYEQTVNKLLYGS